MTANTLERVKFELPDNEAQALAQFVKPLTLSSMPECAFDEEECYEILAAIDKLQRALLCSLDRPADAGAAK